MTPNYYCFNEKGETNLPDNFELKKLKGSGLKPVIFLDSCVCLHIVKLIDHKKKAGEINKLRILNLKEYYSKHDIQINPLFGLMELSQEDNNFDKEKFWDLCDAR